MAGMRLGGNGDGSGTNALQLLTRASKKGTTAVRVQNSSYHDQDIAIVRDSYETGKRCHDQIEILLMGGYHWK